MSSQRNEFESSVEAVANGGDPDELARALYDRLGEDERLGLLDGDLPFWSGLTSLLIEGYNVRPYVMGEVSRLGIPGIRFVDGPRGCVSDHGTAFPVPMARGATWDVALEERVGDVIGREVAAAGGNFFGGVCINLPRHPAWGRVQETYGDEPYHLGEFGAALTRGVQRHVMACAKHFALNSMENARFKVNVWISKADLHDMYLPHFKRAIDEGVAGVMSAYNMVNDEWAGENAYLLTDVLRKQWRWTGITISDFIWGLRDPAKSVRSGLDLEAPFAQQRAERLAGQMTAGEVGWDAVNRCGINLLAAQIRNASERPVPQPSAEILANDEARALAREVAGRSMVLLRNEEVDGTPVLPLRPSAIRTLAVIGRLAGEPNMGDAGSSDVRPPSFVTPIDGIRAAYPDAELLLVTADDPEAAAGAAARADAAIVVAGFDKHDEGEFLTPSLTAQPELMATFPPLPDGVDQASLDAQAASMETYGGDRASLTLRPVEEAVIAAVAAVNPRTVVAIVAAGAVLMEAWRERVPATLMMWYAGMEGGHALADILSGARNPSGRLPYSIPTSPDHLPPYDREATEITYGRLHGQRLLDFLGVDAAYPHGFGLSYTGWSIGAATVATQDDDGAEFDVTVTNDGDRDGHHVVQVYGRSRTGLYAGQAMLLGFVACEVAAGETRQVRVQVAFLPLAVWNPDAEERQLPDRRDIVLEVGSYAADPLARKLALA